MKKYLTIPALAKLLGTNRINVYRKVKSGEIPAERVGRNYVISDNVVSRILNQQLSEKDKKQIAKAVKKVVRDYDEVLKRLAHE